MPGSTPDNAVGATDPWTAVLPPAIDNSFGAILVGSFVGYMLYGLALHQGYRYFRIVGYERDTVYVKGTVATVLILETLHTALAMDLCYSYLVTNYFKPQALLHSTWTADILPAVTGLIVAITQGFFAGRVVMLNRKYLAIVAFVVCLLVGELGFAIACSVEAFIQPDLFHIENLKWLSTATLALIISTNGMLVPVLTWILFKSRMSMKPRRTDSMLSTLMLYSVNNGLLAGTLSLISLLMAIRYPHTLLTDGLNICVTKIYTNSLLSVLIHRQFLPQREYKSPETSLTESEQDDRFHTRTHSQGSTGSLSVLHIKVTQDVVRDTHSVGTVSEDAHHHYHGYEHDHESKGWPEYNGAGADVQFTWRPAAGAVATV